MNKELCDLENIDYLSEQTIDETSSFLEEGKKFIKENYSLELLIVMVIVIGFIM